MAWSLNATGGPQNTDSGRGGSMLDLSSRLGGNVGSVTRGVDPSVLMVGAISVAVVVSVLGFVAIKGK